MEEFRYDTYCGLYCGACDIMSVFKGAIERNDKAKWEDIPPELRKNIPTPKTDAIICYGCKSDTVFVNCSKCPIRKCAKTKMHVETCFQCTKFPCVRFRIHSVVRKLMQRRLPHLRSIPANRTCIQHKGIPAWLFEQEAEWKCSKCGAAFTWYGKVCTSCGNDLDFRRRFSS